MKTIDYIPISIERTSWKTSEPQLTEIRRQVFVVEQQVPAELDLDEHDNAAIHWLAYVDDNPVATARLKKDGQIGRMVVLESYRNKGIGSSLMRAIIKYATHEYQQTNVGELTLSAQLQAIPFYEGFGFQQQGEKYLDAGIEHINMRLPLHLQQQRHQRQNQHHLKNISDEERLRSPIEGSEAFFKAAKTLIEVSEHKIRIFSLRLLPDLYDDAALCNAFYEFVTRHSSAKIQILLKDIEWLSRHSHQLHELGIRLSSHIEFRKLSAETGTLHTEFMLTDETGILYQQDTRRLQGYVVQHAPLEALEMADEFDSLWEQGQPDPELRRLHI